MSYKMIDLFAGCGGLEDGFLQSGKYEDIAAVEWLQPQVKTLINRLETKWGIADAKDRVMCFDIQREDELFKGWSDASKVENFKQIRKILAYVYHAQGGKQKVHFSPEACVQFIRANYLSIASTGKGLSNKPIKTPPCATPTT